MTSGWVGIGGVSTGLTTRGFDFGSGASVVLRESVIVFLAGLVFLVLFSGGGGEEERALDLPEVALLVLRVFGAGLLVVGLVVVDLVVVGLVVVGLVTVCLVTVGLLPVGLVAGRLLPGNLLAVLGLSLSLTIRRLACFSRSRISMLSSSSSVSGGVVRVEPSETLPSSSSSA